MATISGARHTLNVSQSQRKVDMKEEILLLDADVTPLLVLSKKIGKKVTHNPEYSWQEDSREPRFDAVNNGAGYLSTDTAITVDNGAYFAAHDTVLVTRTGELVLVYSVLGNVLTIRRGVGSTAAALVDNDELLISASAQPEGDTPKIARSSNPTKVTNYTQIMRESIHSTRTQRQSDQFTKPNDWAYQAGKAANEHKLELEYAFWFGKPAELTEAGLARRTTGGVFHFATANQTDAGGQLTEAEFFGALRPIFRYGKEKWGFSSGLVTDVLQQFPRSKVQVIEQAKKDYGVNVMRFISPHGVLNLVNHWLLEGTKYGGYLQVLDLSVIRYRFLGNENGSADSHLIENVQQPGEDGRKDEWLAEVGLEFGLASKHGAITGITSGPQS